MFKNDTNRRGKKSAVSMVLFWINISVKVKEFTKFARKYVIELMFFYLFAFLSSLEYKLFIHGRT